MVESLKHLLFEAHTSDGLPLFNSGNQMAAEISKYQYFETDTGRIINRYYHKRESAVSYINRALRVASRLSHHVKAAILGACMERTRQLPSAERSSILSELSILIHSIGRGAKPLAKELPRTLLEAALACDERDSEILNSLAALEVVSDFAFSTETFESLLRDAKMHIGRTE